MDDKEQKPKDDADFTIDENGKEVKEAETTEPLVKKEKNPDSRRHRFLNWYKENKKKSVPLTALVLLLLLAAVPWTRYTLAGTVLKKDLSIRVMDSTANTPVSEAEVSVGSIKAKTDGSGRVTLKQVKVGNHTAQITKKYYKESKQKVLIPILKQKSVPTVKLEATGRQAKVTVVNFVNGEAVEGAKIEVGDIQAKTDQKGTATVVLPANTTSAKATLNLDGYNQAGVEIKVSDKTIKDNLFKLTPNGKIYFLSKLSGKIDVVKTNLDGTQRQTVLAGTGREENSNTVLLASRDWKYLALLSRRDGTTNPKLYLLDTSNDKLTTMDEGNISITLVGWSDNNFIYSINRLSTAEWQPKKFALKSYNANNKQNLILDQNDASGDGSGYAQEQISSIFTAGNNVVYSKSWYKYNLFYYNATALDGKSSGLYSIKSDGSNKKTVKTFDAKDVSYINLRLYEPNELYMTVNLQSGSAQYFEYDGGNVKNSTADKVSPDDQYNTYLLSPSGNQTFWSEARDGKNTLFLGDEKGSSSKQVVALSEFRPYGWYTDSYLLVSKKDSELYIMPKVVTDKQQPIKISDYHKPAQNFYGYGGGYGGI